MVAVLRAGHAREYSCSAARDLARRLAALGPAQVVIKLGAQGCVALVGGEEHRQDAIPVTAVDTVGAVDTFVGGYLDGQPARQRLLTAVCTGAYACLVSGDWEGMPRRSELGLLGTDEPMSR